MGLAPPGSSLADVDETQLVQLVYDAYSRYSERPDGERVELELDGFRTVYRQHFDDVAHYPDLMTLGTEWEIRTTIRRSGVNGEETVWYDAEWVPIESREVRMPHLLGQSVLEILALGVEHVPSQRRIVAITSYRVRASYLGRSKEYRASVRWHIDEKQDLQLTVVDNVVPEVGLAVAETTHPTAGAEPPGPALPFDRVAAASTAATCLDQTWPTHYSTQKADHNPFEHLSGRHEAVYIGEFTCSCDSSCTSECTADFLASACQDYGTLAGGPDLEHRTHREVRTNDGISFSGQSVAPQCASGLGCFVQSCHGGACGSISVQVSIGVASITFSTSAPTILRASFDANATCGLCTETTSAPPPMDEPVEQGGTESPPGDGTECTWNCQGESPIVVDLDRRGFRFSDLAGGVRFDLDGDGEAESISWLAADSGDGWLALDRDGNGTIDDGAELFGNWTPQPPSPEPHGFLALAVYDRPSAGGDGDGAITAADAVFASLRLWIDGDRDGSSQEHELTPLAATGVRAIELAFVESERRDLHGNRLRYASRVRLDGGTTRCADVFLLAE
ncbi:MAG TPA: hypothetical protein VHM02_02035 [Thermoanaerobaculia bacterium]|nr:hypothetical protein [Thermoanaerobaculia bacterium]